MGIYEKYDDYDSAVLDIRSAIDNLRPYHDCDDLVIALDDIEYHLSNRRDDLHMHIEAQEAAEQAALEREYFAGVL